MHTSELDLNLLIPLEALLEERHVSRAAARVQLTQSAMSRALARLRRALGDELLVRTANTYELTPRARVVKRELEYLMPRIHALGRPPFDAATATDLVRLSCSDYITLLYGEPLFTAIFQQAPSLSLTIEALSPATVADVEHGRVDLAFVPFRPASNLSWLRLFDEDFVCLLAADHPVDRVTLADLASYPQAGAVFLAEEAMILERRLAELGVQPPSVLRVPYFSAVAAALPGTRFIATLPRRLAVRYAEDPRLRLVEAPAELNSFSYGLVWHPRLDQDPLHRWLRTQVTLLTG
ncbi:LysR family transcriptional regulator [Kribbella sp. NPDC058245]|uniref:LysR family transcriptional regulator n=1 Tax=Kribbella sp. NPDC058245 TaxID=3346399 RepID=UPI0036F051C2